MSLHRKVAMVTGGGQGIGFRDRESLLRTGNERRDRRN